MWLTLTIINILLAAAAIISLINLIRNYLITPKMGFYIFLSIVSVMLLFFTQLNALTNLPGNPWMKLAATFWGIKTLYFSWFYRYSCIKK